MVGREGGGRNGPDVWMLPVTHAVGRGEGEDDVMTGDKTHHFDLLLPGRSWTERDTCLSRNPATASGSVRYT